MACSRANFTFTLPCIKVLSSTYYGAIGKGRRKTIICVFFDMLPNRAGWPVVARSLKSATYTSCRSAKSRHNARCCRLPCVALPCVRCVPQRDGSCVLLRCTRARTAVSYRRSVSFCNFRNGVTRSRTRRDKSIRLLA